MIHQKPVTTDRVFTILFLFCLSSIILGTVFSWDFYPVQDCRGLAKKPVVTVRNLNTLPTHFEAYINEHFGFRNFFVYRYNKLARNVFGRRQSNVIKGKDKWLFLRKIVRDYLGYTETKESDLKRWCSVVEGRHAWLAEKGICYVFVIPPNKQTIYGECLPDDIGLFKGETRLEKLLAYMKENSDVPVLDLRHALFEAKKRWRVYGYTDTHWNWYGIFAGYEQLMLRIKQCLPNISDPIRFTPEWLGPPVQVFGDLARVGGFSRDEYTEMTQKLNIDQRYSFTQTENQDDWVVNATSKFVRLALGNMGKTLSVRLTNKENKYCAVLFHDSFMASTPELLINHFGEVYNLWFRADYELLKKTVESYHPDVVIDEVQERALYISPQDHPEFAAARERYLSKKMSLTKKSSLNE